MIQDFADWLVYGLFGLSADTPLGVAVNFFFYDTIKILILLFFISVLMGIINAYFPIERLRNYLMTHKMYGLQYLLASVFGAITPFCSCSSIPLFIGFVKGGIPLGVTFAFLITSPLVNEVAVAMFLGSFGLKVTLIYVISGILLGVIGGVVLGRMRLAPYLTDWVKQIQAQASAQAGEWEKDHTTFLKRLPTIIRDAWKIVSGVLVYILIGIGIGAFMHGFVPEGFFAQHMSDGTLRLLALLLLLHDPALPPLLCLKEPDKGLCQSLLAPLARKLLERAHNTQLLVTAHNPCFVDALAPDTVWLLEKGDDGFAHARRAFDNPPWQGPTGQGSHWYSASFAARE